MILYRYIVLQQQNISTSRIQPSQTPMDLGTSHESASNMPRSLWPAVPLGVQCSGEAEVDEQHEEAEVEEDGARGEARWKERVQRSACVRSAVWHYAWARKAGLKRANKKVVKASTGGGGCTYRGISYWRRRRGLLPRAACLSSLFWCASSLLLHCHFLFPLRFNRLFYSF